MRLRKLKRGRRKVLFCAVMILGALLLIGCGDDGATGPQGPQGPPGDPGADAPGLTTAETCSICHGAGSIADIAVAHPDPTGETVIISAITLTNTAGVPVVSFHLETAGGDPVDGLVDSGTARDLSVDDFRFMLADLVPAGTDTVWGTWDSPYFERWTYERSESRGTIYPQGTLDITDAANGNYTYTFETAFGSAAALDDAPDYDPTHPQRLYMRFDGRDDDRYPQRSVGFLDFIVPAVGNTATELDLDPQRQFVTADACKECHGPNFERAAHAGGYRDTRACVICHSPLGLDALQAEDRGHLMQNTDAYASVFFHKIHAAIDIPHWTEEGRINGLGYSAVTYPQDIRDCVVCHTDSGLDLGDQADQIDNWRTNPTAEICGSCHSNVNFANGTNHGGGAQLDNNGCVFCHPATGGGIGGDVTASHDTTATGRDVPEFDVTISITPPVNGTHYVTGEAPEVSVTLTNRSNGLPVDPAIYTTSQDDDGVTGGGLSMASLYVYGPRAKSVPVLATNTITDPNFDSTADSPTQGHALFVGGTDPQVTTDSTGFSYQLLAIPADMEGTYMVRFEGGDYGALDGDDYVTHSTALINFQVGTDVVEDKVAGAACINCHGDTRMHLSGAHPHNAPFDTDACLGCHDQSGNYGVPIANRAHAVHSANDGEGDIYALRGGNPANRDWSEITFPQDIDGCVICHNSGNDTYKTLPFMMPCAGCHVGESFDVGNDLPFVPGVVDHMRQNGGPW